MTIKSNDYPVLFSGEDEISHHDIQSTGLYVIIFALCDDKAKPVYLDGDIDSVGKKRLDENGMGSSYSTVCMYECWY